MRRRPGLMRAAGLGVAISLWLSADPIGYATAAAMIVSLILVGAGDAVRIDHRRLRLRVWWERRRALVIVCAIVAVGLWILLTTAFFTRSLATVVEYDLRAAFAWPPIAFGRGLRTLDRDSGDLRIHYPDSRDRRRIRDRLATYRRPLCGVVGGVGDRQPGDACGGGSKSIGRGRSRFCLPLTILAAYAVDWMHQSERWNSIRYAIAAGVALTLYVQFAINFVHPAPDTSEAPWRRHALLFWSEPATSIQTVRECSAGEKCGFAGRRERDDPRRQRSAAGAMVSARFCADRFARCREHRRDHRQDAKRRARGQP